MSEIIQFKRRRAPIVPLSITLPALDANWDAFAQSASRETQIAWLRDRLLEIEPKEVRQ